MKYLPLGTLSVVGMMGAFAAAATLFVTDNETQDTATHSVSLSSSLFEVSESSIRPAKVVSLGVTGIDGKSLGKRTYPAPSGGVSVLAFSTDTGAALANTATQTSATSTAFDWNSTPKTSGYGIDTSASSRFIVSSATGSYAAAMAGLAKFPTSSNPYALTNTVGSDSTTSMASLIDQFSYPGTAAAGRSANAASTSTSASALASVPLPAGAPLLVLALGMIGYIRRKA
jgi:hypothetical protein